MAFCRCCFISAIPAGYSTTERPVMLCDECGLHYGQPDKTAVAHDRMMTAQRNLHAAAMQRLDAKREALAVELTRAQQQLAELTATVVSDYRSRPIGDVQNVVEQAVVAEAHTREQAARKARDRAMSVISTFEEMHHEEGDRCSCSNPITKCEEFKALGNFRNEYSKWELRQIDLLKQGKHHGLPLNHPLGRGVNKRDWKGLPSTLPS